MLMEVVISALLVGLIVVATFTGFDVVNRVTAEQRRHNEAALLAAQSQEQLRSNPATTLDTLESEPHVYTRTVGGTVFTITQQAQPVNATGTATGCNATETKSKTSTNILITSTVTWPTLKASKRPAVEQSSIITPPTGSALEVDITNGAAPADTGLRHHRIREIRAGGRRRADDGGRHHRKRRMRCLQRPPNDPRDRRNRRKARLRDHVGRAQVPRQRSGPSRRTSPFTTQSPTPPAAGSRRNSPTKARPSGKVRKSGRTPSSHTTARCRRPRSRSAAPHSNTKPAAKNAPRRSRANSGPPPRRPRAFATPQATSSRSQELGRSTRGTARRTRRALKRSPKRKSKPRKRPS